MWKGEAVEAEKASSFEIWVDTSSSMREMDYTDKEGGCYRKSLLKDLMMLAVDLITK